MKPKVKLKIHKTQFGSEIQAFIASSKPENLWYEWRAKHLKNMISITVGIQRSEAQRHPALQNYVSDNEQ